jgi:hypothetical protein
MKIRQGILLGAFALFFATAIQTFAIENLKLSLQCSNVVLTWPSVEGETYIIRSRPDLDPNTPWTEVTNSLPAALGTNLTVFVHSNVVIHPNCGGSFGGGSSAGSFAASAVQSTTVDLVSRPVPPLPPFPWDTNAWATTSGTSYVTSFDGIGFGSPDGPSGGPANGPTVISEARFYEVVRTGPHLFGVTNGTILQGVVQLPVELGFTNGLVLDGVSALVETNLLDGATVDTITNNRIVLNWDTSYTPNGTYPLHLEADFQFSDSMSNNPVMVTVSNTVTFNNFNAIFGSQMWIFADVSLPTYDYEIKMFDGGNNYLGSFVDTNQSGPISFLWDLSAGGPPLTDTNFTAQFLVSAPGTHGLTNPPPTMVFTQEEPWDIGNYFAIAWSASQLGFNANNLDTLMQDGAVNILGGGGYNLNPGNIYQGSTFRLDGNTRTNFLLQVLASPNYRHFYFNGHSNLKKFGYFGDTNSLISIDEVRLALGNYLHASPSTNRVIMHPYRFVFMDSCNAGRGDWCEAFGIHNGTYLRSTYSLAGLTSRAFLGFTESVPAEGSKSGFYSSMLGNFFNDWLSAVPLNVMVARARSDPYYPLPAPWVIHGAANLEIDKP